MLDDGTIAMFLLVWTHGSKVNDGNGIKAVRQLQQHIVVMPIHLKITVGGN